MPGAHNPPILCYVTDRVGLNSSGQGSRSGCDSLQAQLVSVHDAVAAGIDWIQIREKDLSGYALAELGRAAISEARATGSRVLMNDRLDVAVAVGASGVHLGEASIPIKRVREWRGLTKRAEFLIGASCHSLESAQSAERAGADYVIFGPVFATPSKARFGPPQGTDQLRRVCAALGIPVLAIGGINLQNAASCISAGASGIAAIRLFQQAQNIAAARELLKLA